MAFRDNSARAKRARNMVLVTICLVPLEVYTLYLTYQLIEYTESVALGGDVDLSKVMGISAQVGVISFIQMGIFIANSITFIQWFRRAYYNLHQLPDSSPSYTEGWAAGSWFVPIMWWFRPFIIMREIWESTVERLQNIDSESYTKIVKTSKSLGTWWTMWVLSSVTSSISSGASNIDDSFDTASVTMIFNGLSIIFSFVSGLLLIKIIDTYRKIVEPNLGTQKDMYETFGAAQKESDFE